MLEQNQCFQLSNDTYICYMSALGSHTPLWRLLVFYGMGAAGVLGMSTDLVFEIVWRYFYNKFEEETTEKWQVVAASTQYRVGLWQWAGLSREKRAFSLGLGLYRLERERAEWTPLSLAREPVQMTGSLSENVGSNWFWNLCFCVPCRQLFHGHKSFWFTLTVPNALTLQSRG